MVGGTYVYFAEARQRATLVAQATTLESALIAALFDPNLYADATVKDDLTHNRIPASFPIRIQSEVGDFNLNLNQDYQFSPSTNTSDQRLNTCIGTNCEFTLRVAMRPREGRMAFAYGFKVNSGKTSFLYVGGSDKPRDAGSGFTFADEDFNLFIPYELYINSLMTQCDPNRYVGVGGYKKDSAEVKCIEPPAAPCPAGSVAKNLRYDSTTKKIEFNCVSLKRITCPNNYSLQTFDPDSLDKAIVSGTCVYSTADTGTTSIGGPGNVIATGHACPPNYTMSAASSVVPVATSTSVGSAGDCVSYCNSWSLGAPVAFVGTPPNPACTRSTFTCDSTGTTRPALPPAVSLTINYNAVPGAFLVTTTPAAQMCGATWNGYVQVNIVCERQSTTSQTVPAGSL